MLLLVALKYAPIVRLFSDYIIPLFERLSTIPFMQLFGTFQLRLFCQNKMKMHHSCTYKKHNFQQIKSFVATQQICEVFERKYE